MQTPADRPFSAAAASNAAPILEVLRHEFRECREVLEIGSGTGQHAVHFAAEMDRLVWQTSDLDDNHAGIRASLAAAGLANVLAPISLDVTDAILDTLYDGVYSANTAHIMSADAVLRMIALVGRVLRPNGIFCLYGPFRRYGRFNTESNARFDASLHAQNSSMGIRDLEALDVGAAKHGLCRDGLYAMPSNNLVVTWRKTKT